MQHYHLEVERIPKYINMLEDAQKQAGRSGRTISDETLLLFVSTAMLTTEQYPRINNDWEDQAKEQNIWDDWKTSYKRAHSKARVKEESAEGLDKLGAANGAERILKTREVATRWA